ncbi:thiol:disulfide interchange protein DsbA/DsbL [Streptomyces sp. CB01881]|uniref:thiol:disulfide interchange protein DsbA/DsbL n=1 Tax=Streptomyces sp. CB01881 TaxID=2078691 RepID=UPI001386CDF2|nr:thiol:disulfide interchange protein DsbA/DsbL [Streptomyces sp. CB01881]
MKTLLRSTVLLAVATGIAASPVQADAATSQPATEGSRFTRIDQPQAARASARTEAVEFFWYDCSHSQQLEKPLQAWTEKHREDVDLRRVPAIWPRSRGEVTQRGHARLYYTLERLDLVERLQTSAFRAIHSNKQDLTTEETATNWALRQGVDPQQFRDAYRSADVQQAVDEAAAMFVRYGINELPTVVVQGEQRTSPTQAGGVEAMPDVLDRLVQQDQQRNPRHEQH